MASSTPQRIGLHLISLVERGVRTTTYGDVGAALGVLPISLGRPLRELGTKLKEQAPGAPRLAMMVFNTGADGPNPQGTINGVRVADIPKAEVEAELDAIQAYDWSRIKKAMGGG